MTDEQYLDWVRERKARGGRAKVPKGFAKLGHAHAVEAGRKGGKVSRRPKNSMLESKREHIEKVIEEKSR